MRALVVIGCIAISARAHADPQAGWAHYEQLCAACHGSDGDGRGPAAPYSRGAPRDFTRGAFEWRSTPFGTPPTDDDLRTTLRLGARGTSMPGFAGVLDDAEIGELIAIVRAFGPAGGSIKESTHPVDRLAGAGAASPVRKRSPPSTAAEASAVRPIALAPEPPENATRGAVLWTQLGCERCHGTDGHGDGPAAAALAERPYDLVAEPLHRPRDGDTHGDRRRAAAWSIATGMTGTAMPGYAGQIATDDLWALADRVVALGASAHDDVMALGRATLAVGTWPGADPDEASVFGAPLAPQGPPPASLAPAEASLSAAQCGRCHAKQVREWRPSLHAGATSPGFAARLADGADPASCRRCHAPLAEQVVADPLYAEGVQCAGCHVRGWTRRGPPRVSPTLLARPGYPFTPSPIYERSDFCMTCHQLPPSSALAGKPLLNTYKEWLEGPYMRRGIECQSCHMPNREHRWLGVHDPTTFRQGIRLTTSARRDGDAIAITAELANVGAGHDLPTTPTPAVWLRLELVDGTHIVGSFAQRIGRDIYWDGRWHERADTRIPPGESLHVARVWRGAHATMARVTIEVHPDDYYERLYAQKLAEGTPARVLYEAALLRARGSHYIAETREIALP